MTKRATTKLTSQFISSLEKKLRKQVFGQDEVLHGIVEEIGRGMNNPDRTGPVATIRLAGGSGTGKTTLIKNLAVILDAPLLQYDMGEFGSSFSACKLTGMPQGDASRDEKMKSDFDCVSQNDVAVISFDTLNKAHPEVTQLVEKIKKDGSITLSNGRTIDLKNAIIFETYSDSINRQNTYKLLIKGTVADHVEIAVTDVQNKNTINSNNIIISGNNNIVRGTIVNGDIVGGRNMNSDDFNKAQQGPSDLTIRGKIGNNVRLDSETSIDIGNAGDDLYANADNSIDFYRIGENANLDTGNSCTGLSIGKNSIVDSGNSVSIDDVRDECIINAGNSVMADTIGENAMIEAGNSIIADSVAKTAYLKASNSIKYDYKF